MGVTGGFSACKEPVVPIGCLLEEESWVLATSGVKGGMPLPAEVWWWMKKV